jgi:hypothetical protein
MIATCNAVIDAQLRDVTASQLGRA